MLQDIEPVRAHGLPLVHGLRNNLDDVLQLDALVGDELEERALPGADVALDAEGDAAVGCGGAQAVLGAFAAALFRRGCCGRGGFLLLAAGLVIDVGDVVCDLVGVSAVADADLVLRRKEKRGSRKRGGWGFLRRGNFEKIEWARSISRINNASSPRGNALSLLLLLLAIVSQSRSPSPSLRNHPHLQERNHLRLGARGPRLESPDEVGDGADARSSEQEFRLGADSRDGAERRRVRTRRA